MPEKGALTKKKKIKVGKDSVIYNVVIHAKKLFLITLVHTST